MNSSLKSSLLLSVFSASFLLGVQQAQSSDDLSVFGLPVDEEILREFYGQPNEEDLLNEHNKRSRDDSFQHPDDFEKKPRTIEESVLDPWESGIDQGDLFQLTIPFQASIRVYRSKGPFITLDHKTKTKLLFKRENNSMLIKLPFLTPLHLLKERHKGLDMKKINECLLEIYEDKRDQIVHLAAKVDPVAYGGIELDATAFLCQVMNAFNQYTLNDLNKAIFWLDSVGLHDGFTALNNIMSLLNDIDMLFFYHKDSKYAHDFIFSRKEINIMLAHDFKDGNFEALHVWKGLSKLDEESLHSYLIWINFFYPLASVDDINLFNMSNDIHHFYNKNFLQEINIFKQWFFKQNL